MVTVQCGDGIARTYEILDWFFRANDSRAYNTVSYKQILRADPCSYCGGTGGTVDHISPRLKGRKKHGIEVCENLTDACSDCNRNKGSQAMLLFMLRRSRQDENLAHLNRVRITHRNIFGHGQRLNTGLRSQLESLFQIWDRGRSCKEKEYYETERTADGAAHAMERKGVPGLHSYRCRYCAGWHIRALACP